MLVKNASITRISLFLTVFLLFFGFSHAQDSAITCQNISFRIQGPEKVLVDKEYDYSSLGYSINYNTGSEETTGSKIQDITTGTYYELLGEDTKIEYDIVSNNKVLNRFYTDPSYAFTSAGKYQLQATIEHPQCAYKIVKDITAYDEIYTIIGQWPNETLASIAENTAQQDIGFVQIDNTTSRKKTIKAHKQSIRDAKTILISSSDFSDIFDSLEGLSQSGQELQDILLLTENPKAITKKVIAPFLKSSSLTNIFLLDTQEITNIMIQLSVGDNPIYKNLKISYENKSILGSLDTIIDNLIYQGFPIELMSIILSLTLAIAIIVFRKQVVGFSSFGVYYPLLFGLYIHLLGPKTSIGLLVIAFISICIVALINNKLTLLSSAKTGTIIVFYFILSLIGIRATKKFINRPIQFSTFSQYLFVAAYITIPLIAQKIVGTKISKPQKKLGQTTQFLALSTIIYIVFQNSTIQEKMLIHPIYTLFIAVIIIILGRYTGLQLTEFIRFSHLIGHIIKQKKTRGKT